MKIKRKATTLAVVGLSALLLAPTAAFAAAPVTPPAPTTSYSASVTTPATGQVTTTSSGYIDFINHSSQTAYLDWAGHPIRGNWYWTAPFPEGTAPDPTKPLTKNPDQVVVPPGQEVGVDLTHTAGSFQGGFQLTDSSGRWFGYDVGQWGKAAASVASPAHSWHPPNFSINVGVRRTFTIFDGQCGC